MKRRLFGALTLFVGVPLLLGPLPNHAAMADTAPVFVPAAPQWHACTDPELAAAKLQCGSISVPLNYADPTGATVKIALSRRLHTSTLANYKGILLTNPGGPGQSGRTMPEMAPYVPNGAGKQYDWIGFDPRGVGASTPRLHCDSTYFNGPRPYYVPIAGSNLAATWRAKAHRYAEHCGASTASALLPYLKTTDNAQDMDMIRQALGKEKLSYYGYSYGTYLGQVYATMFPSRVDRFVLDGVVNPTRTWYQANLDQDRAFDRNLNVYWRWLSRHPGAYKLGTDWRTIRAGYFRELRKLRAHRAAGGRLGPDELTDVMLDAGYGVYDWDFLGHAYSDLVRRNHGGILASMYSSSNAGGDNGYAIYVATECTDMAWPGWAKTRDDSVALYKSAPFATWGNTWFNAPCLTWPAAAGTALTVDGSAVTSKILLVSETRDAATPYSGALKARQLFPTASLIAGVNGTTHASSMSGVGCVDNAVASYLTTGVPPTRTSGPYADKRCPAVPPPPATRSGARVARHGMPLSLRERLLPRG